MPLALLLSVIGCVVVAGARAAYGLWVIVDKGGSVFLSQIGLDALAFQVLELHRYGAIGAALGLAVAALVLWRRRRMEAARLLALNTPVAPAAREADPHDKLRAAQRATAERYLSQKRRERQREND